jgi:hypothetical protein
MIQALSNRFRRPIAAVLYVFFYCQIIGPLYVSAMGEPTRPLVNGYWPGRHTGSRAGTAVQGRMPASDGVHAPGGVQNNLARMQSKNTSVNAVRHIGGPNTPESSSFKTVNSDNLVNLFTGDFSYSIPLLDVGGYPVNIFYNGGITMEQEASWVGLGWNINPGSVSRNMRGVPDDFDGTDTLVQTQKVKPNKTWGGEIGLDGEALGIKTPNVNFNLGFSYNNYLGPAMELGAGVSVSIPIIQSEAYDDQAPSDTTQGLSLSLGVNAKLSSRSGLTLAPSLNANIHSVSTHTNEGIGISTSYNSRTGIQNLNITSQASLYGYTAKDKKGNLNSRPTTLLSADLTSTTITFARPSYLPTLRMPMQYSNYSGQLEVGAGMFGARFAGTAQGYYSESSVADGCTTISKPLVGYLYLDKANGHTDAVMDFNRLNDGAVTPNTPVVSAPQYDYDIFSVQGEGTGGSIRAYRNDLGYMRDHLTTSKDKNISIGFDIAPLGHYGGNWNTVSAPTHSGNWDDANNTLTQTLQFSANTANSSFEHVYFRNPGEATVTNDNMIDKIGSDNLVRFLLDGSPVTPVLETKLEQFSKHTGAPMGTIPLMNANASQTRDKRTQVVTMLTAADATRIGLETSLRSYQTTLDGSNNLQYTSIPRVGGYRKGHHISEINVLESSGIRYVYGLPVYNTIQQDFTFSVQNVGDATTNLVNYNPADPTPGSSDINGNTGIDGYVNIQQTPAYASSFLITGLLSPDYVDVTGNGITEDDLGNAVKFDYTMSAGTHKWRTPRSNATANTAHFNVGLKTEVRDNKATISYGEREAWYLHAIESKSLIAIFSTSARSDAKGVTNNLNGIANSGENVNLKLDSISLYTKADIKAHGLSGAVPLKTVHFDYSYALCNGTPDNPSGGKLTLNDIYFTFNGQSRVSKDMYLFNYGNTASNFDNAPYAANASDRWGTYKPVKDSLGIAVNPNGMSNIDYPYTSANKAADDQYAGEWSLKKVLLPSGGQIEVTYEADDYAYLQDRKACNLYTIYGFGSSTAYTTSNMLYTIYANQDQNYVYVQLPTPLLSKNPASVKQEIFSKYLAGLNQLAFKLNINMPKGMETLTAYAGIADYGLCTNSTDGTVIYLKLATVDGHGPLANASVQFLINNLPGQAFPGYDLSDATGLTAFFDLIAAEVSGLSHAFTNAVDQMRSDGKGSSVSLANSFVRLGSPTFFKYGGGHRVKRVVLKDNWNAMSGQYLSQYGQDYDYTTTQMINGVATTMSSGVASYEPGIGSEENPFREILQFEDKLPLASAQYGAIEMPTLEGFYPAPVVGYSKVTVRSINRNGTHGDSVVRSAIGKQVTEFYTAKDFPSFSTYTPMNNMDYHHAPPFSFFYKETIDKRTTSQGFLVETNDMHGKLKSQSVYSESDGNTPLSYTIHTYRNTGANGMNDRVDFVHNDQGGTVTSGNMGVDMELMTDVREFSVTSNGTNGQAQVDFFTFAPWPIFGVFAYVLASYTENTYRAVTTTKLINYHAIEDSVIVNDKGSTVTTKTIAYDAETGSPLVTKTRNEFNDPIYNVTYPAWWAYSGMAPAYTNIGMKFSGVNISSGQIISGLANQSHLESGDELYITSPGSGSPTCLNPSPAVNKLWVFDMNKDMTALTVPSANRNLVFMDSIGRLFTAANVSFMIVRSGRRNDLGLTAGSASMMLSPIQTVGGVRKLLVNNADSVVAASASAYREKWQTDADEIPTTITTVVNCVSVESANCGGVLPSHVNPYVKGLVGNYKPFRSYVYYGSRIETNPAVDTRIRKNGYITGFGHYWNFDTNSNLVPDNTNTNWLWNSELTKVNGKGQELETHDALNRYTAAQYGYAKNFPVAVVQNARDGRSFDDGFEDYNYKETLNVTTLDTCDNTRYISFNGLANSSIVNTDTGSLKAHSGQYFLKVNGGSQAVKPLAVTAAPLDSFNFNWKADSTGTLNTPGGNITSIFVNPNFATTVSPNLAYLTNQGSFSNGGYSSGTISSGNNSSSTGNNSKTSTHNFNYNVDYYIQVPVPTSYIFQLSASSNTNTSSNTQDISTLQMTISDLNNNQIGRQTASSGTATLSVSLCAGIYHISAFISDMFTAVTPVNATISSTNTYSVLIAGSPSITDYSSPSITPNCRFTDPIPATDSMLNQQFALVPGQQMQFSAWMRQDCGTPCFVGSYADNVVNFQFPGSAITPTATIHTTGTIIEGWQKVEGVVTVPSDAKTANLLLGNSSAGNVYFDDIRLHPFNADMKSYVYDPRTLRLSAELDENNYTTFYDYDEEGQLVRVKKETIQGIKTIKETRTAKQKPIKAIQ